MPSRKAEIIDLDRKEMVVDPEPQDADVEMGTVSGAEDGAPQPPTKEEENESGSESGGDDAEDEEEEEDGDAASVELVPSGDEGDSEVEAGNAAAGLLHPPSNSASRSRSPSVIVISDGEHHDTQQPPAIAVPTLPVLPKTVTTTSRSGTPQPLPPSTHRYNPSANGHADPATSLSTNIPRSGNGTLDVDGEEDLKHSPRSKVSKGRSSTANTPPLGGTTTLHPPPPAPAAVPSSSAKPSSAASPSQKPKSTAKKARSPSPSPPPPYRPPPMQTIRLDIVLGGPEDYEVDVRKLAKETGQRPATPPLATTLGAGDTSESEREQEVKEVDITKTKKRKKKGGADYYDVSDPFIDDSELAIDSRTFFAQTKQHGFYVSSGEVALLKDRSGTTKPPSSAHATSGSHPLNLLNPDTEPGTEKKKKKKLELHAHSTIIANLHQNSQALARQNAAAANGVSIDQQPGTSASTSGAAGSGTTSHSHATGVITPADMANLDLRTVTLQPYSVNGSVSGRRKKNAVAIADSKDEDVGNSPDRPIPVGQLSDNENENENEEQGAGYQGDDDEESKKPKSRTGRTRSESKAAAAATASANANAIDADDTKSLKRKRGESGSANGTTAPAPPASSSASTAGNKKRKMVVDVQSFHPELRVSLEKLKEAIAKEDWSTKGKFPPNLKPVLSQLAMQAIKLGEYNDNFWSLMPTLFPYNKFTMSKLIKRTVYPDHIAFLNEEIDVLLKKLEEEAKEGFPKAEKEWQQSVRAWEARKRQVDKGEGGDSGVGTRQGTEEVMEVDDDGHDHHAHKLDSTNDPNASGSGAPPASQAGSSNAGPPAKRYRMTDSMKQIVYQLVLLSNECCRVENEKNNLEGSVIQASEQGLRKMLYQRVVAAFPEGWMTSGQISRDVSAMKKRYEREALEDD